MNDAQTKAINSRQYVGDSVDPLQIQLTLARYRVIVLRTVVESPQEVLVAKQRSNSCCKITQKNTNNVTILLFFLLTRSFPLHPLPHLAPPMYAQQS